MSEVKNLMQGLLEEMNRVREIIQVYKKTPGGQLAAAMMEEAIKLAEEAAGVGDVIEMLKCYEQLKNYEL